MATAILSQFVPQASEAATRGTRYQIAEIASDLLALAAAWHLTIAIRPLLNPFMSVQLDRTLLLELSPPLTSLVLLTLVAQIWIRRKRPGRGLFNSCDSISPLEAWIVAVAVAIIQSFVFEFGYSISRSFVILFTAAYLPMLFPARLVARGVTLLFDLHWPRRERVAVLGHGRIAVRVAQRLQGAISTGVQLVGIIVPEGVSRSLTLSEMRLLGTTDELAAVINRERLDRILIIDKSLRSRDAERCVRTSKRMGVFVSRTIGDPGTMVRFRLSSISGLNVLDVAPVEVTYTQEVLKRLIDIVASVHLIILLAPLLCLIAILIKITSRGPVLYCAPRVGKGGRHFTFFKFRSMYVGADENRASITRNEKNGHIFKMREDPRITPLGRVLRRFSFDELPQLFNVLRGEMSLVGPRPLPAQDLDADGQSRGFRFWAESRSKVLPGVTGLWQIRGRSDLDFEDMTKLDIEYIRNWSLYLDLNILLETPLVVLSGRGAY